jgi:hypothetical protein
LPVSTRVGLLLPVPTVSEVVDVALNGAPEASATIASAWASAASAAAWAVSAASWAASAALCAEAARSALAKVASIAAETPDQVALGTGAPSESVIETVKRVAVSAHIAGQTPTPSATTGFVARTESPLSV